jgi:hypothetical protein
MLGSSSSPADHLNAEDNLSSPAVHLLLGEDRLVATLATARSRTLPLSDPRPDQEGHVDAEPSWYTGVST